MAKRTYYKGCKFDIWQGMDSSWCLQAINSNPDNEILTQAGYPTRQLAIKAAKAAIDKAVEFKNHRFI